MTRTHRAGLYRLPILLSLLFLLALPAPLPAATAKAPLRSYEVLASHPHDPEAFTQGLVYAIGPDETPVFYESTGLNRESTLRRVDPESGEVLQRVDLSPVLFGEGLALLDDTLYVLTWRSGQGFRFAAKDLTQTGNFAYRGEGWGLTELDGRLVMSNGSNTLTVRDPDTFAVERTLAVHDGPRPISFLNELEAYQGVILANVWQQTRIAAVDPADGRVLWWLDLGPLIKAKGLDSHGVANGIAAAPDGRLFVTGKNWPELFELRLGPLPPLQ